MDTQSTNDTKRPSATLAEQAAFLFGSGGHRYHHAVTDPDIFFVHTPEGDCYIVAVHPEFGYCTCITFRLEKTCIHLLAIELELETLNRIERWEQEQENADHPHWGCEPGGARY